MPQRGFAGAAVAPAAAGGGRGPACSTGATPGERPAAPPARDAVAQTAEALAVAAGLQDHQDVRAEGPRAEVPDLRPGAQPHEVQIFAGPGEGAADGVPGLGPPRGGPLAAEDQAGGGSAVDALDAEARPEGGPPAARGDEVVLRHPHGVPGMHPGPRMQPQEGGRGVRGLPGEGAEEVHEGAVHDAHPALRGPRVPGGRPRAGARARPGDLPKGPGAPAAEGAERHHGGVGGLIGHQADATQQALVRARGHPRGPGVPRRPVEELPVPSQDHAGHAGLREQGAQQVPEAAARRGWGEVLHPIHHDPAPVRGQAALVPVRLQVAQARLPAPGGGPPGEQHERGGPREVVEPSVAGAGRAVQEHHRAAAPAQGRQGVERAAPPPVGGGGGHVDAAVAVQEADVEVDHAVHVDAPQVRVRRWSVPLPPGGEQALAVGEGGRRAERGGPPASLRGSTSPRSAP